MTILINDRRKIFTIQTEFTKLFPNLKLEFYSKPNKRGGSPGRKIVKSSSKTLAECRTLHNSGEISITPNMTISDLKEYFANSYGLGIKVCARSGSTWIEPNGENKF